MEPELIRFSLFGAVELRNAKGVELRSVLAHSKQTGLLAYLVIGRDSLHRRDRLTALFWPDLDAVHARNALSKALHHLRRALGEEAFVAMGNEEIGVAADQWSCDVGDFEDAVKKQDYEAALSIYSSGQLLDGFHLLDAAEFERWLDAERDKLLRQATEAGAALTDQLEKAGNFSAAADWAGKTCELSPYDEAALRRRMILLDRSGNRTQAISEFQLFENLVRAKLGGEPGIATRTLADSLRAARVAHKVVRSESSVKSEPAQIAAQIPTQSQNRSAGSQPRVWIGFVALSAILLVAGFLYARRDKPQTSRRIAVGLIRNRTGDTAFNELARTATGGIVQEIAQSGAADVVDMRDTSSAAAVVGGNMYSKGDSLVVQMQLLDARDGHIRHQFDPVVEPATNTYAILSRIRQQVGGAVAALTDTLYLPWSTAHSRPPNYAAFQEFMQGLDALVHQGPQPALEHLKKAVALDTSFVEAKVWLLEQAVGVDGQENLIDSISKAARAQRSQLSAFDQISLDRELAFVAGQQEKTYTAARRLVAIAPNTPDAMVFLAQSAMSTRRYDEALSVLHRFDFSKGWLKDLSQLRLWDLQAHRLNGDAANGVEEWRKIRAQSPNDFATCNAGVILLAALGREQGVESLVTECGALPGAPAAMDRAYEVAGRGFRSGGHMDAAALAFRRALAIRSRAGITDRRRRRAVALLECELGEWKVAYSDLRATLDTTDIEQRVTFAVVAAHVGDTATANEALRKLDAWQTGKRPHGQDKMRRAFILLGLGNRTAAITELRKAMDEGVAPAWNAWYIRWELEPLRNNVQFQEMIRPRT